MAYYPPSLPPNKSTSGNALLRVLGAFLSIASMILAFVGILMFYHTTLAGLVFSVLVGILGLRVFVLWLGANRAYPASRNTTTTHSSMYPPAGMNALHPNTQHPVQAPYYAPNAQQPPFASEVTFPLYSTQPGFPPQPGLSPYPPQSSFATEATYPIYPAQDSHSAQAFQTYGVSQPQAALSSSSLIDINEDSLFKLDWPNADERCFILPQAGKAPVECQVSYALDTKKRCYAVTKGVNGSFVPGPWACMIARCFVEYGGTFTSREEFQHWNMECSKRWHTWIQNRWIPTMIVARERNGGRPGDWSNGLNEGAQTTLIGCSLSPAIVPQDLSTLVHIFAIGNGEFFLFSPNTNGEWKMVETFPFASPNEFAARPDTLATVPRLDLLEHAWMMRKTQLIRAMPGDRIVLASSTLAKWLLMQVQQKGDKWVSLLTNTDVDEFGRRIRKEIASGQIEDDDVTMLIIPIS